MNIISFGLCDNKITYALGALENAVLAPMIYPGWQVYMYVNRNVSEKLKHELRKRQVHIVELHGEDYDNVGRDRGSAFCTMWRFYALDLPGVDRVLMRDTDARLNYREEWVIRDWIARDTDMCAIYDHINHISYPLPPHAFACKGGILLDVQEKSEAYENRHRWWHDGRFLKHHLWGKATRSLYANPGICNLTEEKLQTRKRHPYEGFMDVLPELIEIPTVENELHGVELSRFCGHTIGLAEGNKKRQPEVLLDD